MAGFKCFAAALKADPRLCGDAQRDLKQKSLGDFRKQKRERETSPSFSSKSELETHVAAMLKIKEDHPGASAVLGQAVIRQAFRGASHI